MHCEARALRSRALWVLRLSLREPLGTRREERDRSGRCAMLKALSAVLVPSLPLATARLET